MKAVRIIVSGRVQGVFFRKYTQEFAMKLSLVGHVRNRSDGSVEIVAKGKKQNIEELEEWCQTGSPMSHVKQVVKTEIDPGEISETSFLITY